MSENKDLVWDLHGFHQRERAQEFVLGVENKLCIYSASLTQLYTNYNVFFPKEEENKLVILPNPYAHQGTYHGVAPQCVRATSLSIMPLDLNTRGALALLIPTDMDSHRVVPLGAGLRLIQSKLPAGTPFLPLVCKGDLYELDASRPCLRLNVLRMAPLKAALSDLEVQDIKRLVQSGLKDLAQRV